VTGLERGLLGSLAAVCLLLAGFLVWWGIVVGGNAFEASQDNSDAVYLTIAGFLAFFALLFFGLGVELLRQVRLGTRAARAGVACLLLALVPYGLALGEIAYSLNAALVLGGLAAFLVQRFSPRSNRVPPESVS